LIVNHRPLKPGSLVGMLKMTVLGTPSEFAALSASRSEPGPLSAAIVTE